MPVTPTYPGVYIEEIPSGVRTITGVATSITAFIGRAKRGPVNEPITIYNFGEYERIFGGLWLESSMSYAVFDYYQNFGKEAIIVRLCNDASEADIILPTSAPEPNNELHLKASNAGGWGNHLTVTVDYDTKDATDTDLFNLTVTEKNGSTEKHANVSVNPLSPRYLPIVLERKSMLVKVTQDENGSPVMPNVRPDGRTVDATTDSGSDGSLLSETQFTTDTRLNKEGLYALEKAKIFNLLCIPPHTLTGNIEPSLITSAVTYCREKRAMMIIDPPSDWNSKTDAISGLESYPGVSNPFSQNAAIFFPRIIKSNILRDNQPEEFVPCGSVAGVFARTDSQRGVWKAPAGSEASLANVQKMSVPLTDEENGELNQLGINCLRAFPVYGRVVWGARTLDGADRMASEWKYIPVRRTALFIEESLYRGTQWVVFEPNDEPLWAQIRLNVGAFMHNLFRKGAFQGTSPRDAYYVKCDSESTTQNDIDLGIVNIEVGFAPLKPAEFVIIKIQQIAGELEL